MKHIADVPMRECFPKARVVDLEDGDILICLDNYPLTTSMCISSADAVELATRIMCIANNQQKKAA